MVNVNTLKVSSQKIKYGTAFTAHAITAKSFNDTEMVKVTGLRPSSQEIIHGSTFTAPTKSSKYINDGVISGSDSGNK